jgi:hypothetical protein
MNRKLREEFNYWKNELIVGGTVVRQGDNPYHRIPFTALYTLGQDGSFFANVNGSFQLINAMPNAYDTSAVNC